MLPVAVPVSRGAVALWAWRNRTELLDWAGFATRSVPRLQGEERSDVITEARLRARLTNDPRTRGVAGLRVDVSDGVATLSGVVPAEVHDAALAIATDTRGVRRVRDTLRDRGRWSRPAKR
jgi:osmotically-inducible protein OsmY